MFEPSEALDLNAHERAKLHLLPVEKTDAFVTVFMIFAAPVLLCGTLILLGADSRTGRIYEDARLSNSAITDRLLVLFAMLLALSNILLRPNLIVATRRRRISALRCSSVLTPVSVLRGHW